MVIRSAVVTLVAFLLTVLLSTTAKAETCHLYDLNFDELNRGEYVTNQFVTSHKVDISCTGGSHGCRIFDSNVPYGDWNVAGAVNSCKTASCTLGNCSNKNSCGDPDLGTPNVACNNGGFGEGNGGQPGQPGEICHSLGNLLIVDEGGPNKPPDDRVGGSLFFEFSEPVDLTSIDHMDNEGFEDYVIEITHADGTVWTTNGAHNGNGGYALTNLDGTNDVVSLKVILSGSGSVSSIKYKICDDTNQGGGGGDPHIKRWNRKPFQFHGECDLMLVHSDHVNGDKTLDVHLRTTIKQWWSQIESAAMRVGDVTVQMDVDRILVDGNEYHDEDLPIVTQEFTVTEPQIGDEHDPDSRLYVVELTDKSKVSFKIIKEFMNVYVTGSAHDFEHSVGLMGDFHLGKPYNRAGERMYDLHDFAMEWQVNPAHDPLLFDVAREPQLPHEACRMPTEVSQSARRRRLRGDNSELRKQAEQACSGSMHVESCVEDIMNTGLLELAGAW